MSPTWDEFIAEMEDHLEQMHGGGSLTEKRMRAKLSVVALKHGVPTRGLNVVEVISKLKKKRPSKSEDEVLREVCVFYGVEYEEIV